MNDQPATKNADSITTPAITLPKGGGAIRGIGEKFAANPVTGTSSMTIPIAVSAGRAAFNPQLTLSYDSGAGNGPFGFGWSLGLPQITRKTDQGLPQYLDAVESDVFVLTGAEDLVPVLYPDGRRFIDDTTFPGYIVYRYRPRIEGLFARIERWVEARSGESHWRSISGDNITTLYGKTNESRIYDPADPNPENPTRIFSWLICQSYDDKGNAIVYEYKEENSQRIFEDQDGEPVALAHEKNRSDRDRSANRYLKRIKYGNRQANRDGATWHATDPAQLSNDLWMFEMVFDYGEGHYHEEVPDAEGRIFAESLIDPPAGSHWPVRQDPFSSYRSGFEVRTYRLCRSALMFHHFDGEAGVGKDCLVRSTDFSYSFEQNPRDARNPIYSFLLSATQSGYKRTDSGYLKRTMPSVEFEYTQPVVQEIVQNVEDTSLENLPGGLDGTNYQWTDLHGEGIPGILTEQGDAWFYKRNLAPINNKKKNSLGLIEACFAPVERVLTKPNLAGAGLQAQFMDLAGDGQADLVDMNGPVAGLYEHDDFEGWQPFRPFTSRLNRDPRDPNLKFVDLDGDGRADVLVTEDDAFVWHQSLAEAGFGSGIRAARALEEEKGPRLVFADGTQSIYLADLSGDGLTDLVRVCNGEVCYWPNMGYGRFGAKVTMDNSTPFDEPDQFSQNRIRLADIDGSGTTDIIYLHRDGVRIYFNQSGNSWSVPHVLKVFPPVDDLVSIVPVDLLGNGTACLVWSSPLPRDAGRQMRYVNLMGGRKPHLLVRMDNNLGSEIRIEYAPSTKFYLQDKRDGRPWITRLPFPVHVVERLETYDHISRSRFVTRRAYHHGYFDGDEREFRGFGMVEQWDTEQIAELITSEAYSPADNIDKVSHVPPLHTKTWFHTGVYLGQERVSRQFENEYFREPGLTIETARSLLLDDTGLPSGLTVEEEREACRSLKGSMLRQEVYAEDAGQDATVGQVQRAATPYTVTEQSFGIRTVQPRGENRHAVFFTHAREAINYQYERNPTDPRIQHELTLEVDSFGNVLKQASVGYGRRTTILVVDPQGQVQHVPNPGLAELYAADRAKQTTALATYTENRVTNAVEFANTHRNPLPCEALAFEVTGYAPTGPAGRYQASDLVEPDPNAPGRLRHQFVVEVPYETKASGDRRRRRAIRCLRTLYRRDDLDGLLPLGQMSSLGLPGESYRLSFTPGLLAQVFQRPHQGQPTEPLLSNPSAVLDGQAGNQGGYLPSQTLKADGRFPASDPDDHWWVPSGQSFFSSNPADAASTQLREAHGHFFLPRRYRDPFAQDVFVDFDAHDLLMTEIRDGLGNRVTVDANDYRVLQPCLISDPNRNQTAVAFDTLGLVVGTAVMGKPLPAPVEGDTLDGFVTDLTAAQLEDFFGAADPHTGASGLLRNATSRVVYDLDRFRRTQQANLGDSTQWQPVCTATLARETHTSDPLPTEGLKIRIRVSYSDGFGREIQKKIQAESGPIVEGGASVVRRWVGSGWTIYNNKGKPVRQYEPFFSGTHSFEFGVTVGVSPVLFYDPVDRVIATLLPNHTFEKVVFDPWQQTTYDVNDTSAPRNNQTGDPRTDPDVQGYVASYFAGLAADPTTPSWQTWYSQHKDGMLGPREQAAAERAAAHADTPTTAHLDALGRPFLVVTRNRVACAGHDLDGTADDLSTRVELDIEGNQLVVRDALEQAGDPLGRIVARCLYDMLGNRIYQLNMEAGARWVLNDVAGMPIRTWDSRGHNFTTTYDELRRPVEQSVRGTTNDSDPRTLNRDIVVDRTEYGEPLTTTGPAGEALSQQLNLRTRVFRHFDSAGLATNALLDAGGNPITAYDFKGNLLHSSRRLTRDYRAIPDWRESPQLEDEIFEGSTRYDAFDRPIQSIVPHSNLARATRNIIQPVFNEANLLDRVDVWLERADEPAGLLDPSSEVPSALGVTNIDYDAKGQRRRIDYKNGASTFYDYDPLTFQVIRLYTRRGAAFTDDGDNPAPPPATIAAPDRPPQGLPCGLQNLNYTYDPAGNITHIHDFAQQTIYFRNQQVDASNDYTYDALYRLIQASGREHLGQGGRSIPYSHDEAGRVGLVSADAAGRFAPNDGNAMGTYIERYVYDSVDNIVEMQHRSSNPANPGWTRGFTYAETSLTENGTGGTPLKTSNRLTSTTLGPNGANPQVDPYQHDVHGNIIRMPHLGGGQPGPNAHWDYADQLRQADLGGGGTTYYGYDAAGQRVRKVWEKAPGLTEERIYLGGFEIFRKHNGVIGTNTAVLERETLNVVDDKRTIARVETRSLGNDSAPRRLIRYQYGNHLGSASLELDEQAQIISYEEYAPYGSSTYQAVRSQTEVAKRYRYSGMEEDEETRLSYQGARYYARWLGRWLSTDKVPCINKYLYCNSNPIVLVDSDGNAPSTPDEIKPDAGVPPAQTQPRTNVRPPIFTQEELNEISADVKTTPNKDSYTSDYQMGRRDYVTDTGYEFYVVTPRINRNEKGGGIPDKVDKPEAPLDQPIDEKGEAIPDNVDPPPEEVTEKIPVEKGKPIPDRVDPPPIEKKLPLPKEDPIPIPIEGGSKPKEDPIPQEHYTTEAILFKVTPGRNPENVEFADDSYVAEINKVVDILKKDPSVHVTIEASVGPNLVLEGLRSLPGFGHAYDKEMGQTMDARAKKVQAELVRGGIPIGRIHLSRGTIGTGPASRKVEFKFYRK